MLTFSYLATTGLRLPTRLLAITWSDRFLFSWPSRLWSPLSLHIFLKDFYGLYTAAGRCFFTAVTLTLSLSLSLSVSSAGLPVNPIEKPTVQWRWCSGPLRRLLPLVILKLAWAWFTILCSPLLLSFVLCLSTNTPCCWLAGNKCCVTLSKNPLCLFPIHRARPV